MEQIYLSRYANEPLLSATWRKITSMIKKKICVQNRKTRDLHYKKKTIYNDR